MGTKVDNIRQGLRTFDTSFFQVPGRMNVYDEHPLVILDYGHNPAAIQAMVNLCTRLDVEGRRICVVHPGDRRDEDIRDIARQIAQGNFDQSLCDETILVAAEQTKKSPNYRRRGAG